MGFTSSNIQKTIEKSQKKGKLQKVTTPQEARSAAKNKDLMETKAVDLFSNIVDAYADKIKTNTILKRWLFRFSLLVLAVFAVAFIWCLSVVIQSDRSMADSLAILIPAGVTVVTSIVSIIIIIAKYLFPQDEDKNFADLVQVLYKKSDE